MNQAYDIIVIGSGFGGSVSALRLAQKGYKVLILEKGKRYEDDDFPKTNWNLRRFLWFPKLFLYGIQCITLLKNVFILHGAGVGGGSLVYANTLLVPSDKTFNDNRWPDFSWKEKLSPFYDKAKKMLGVTKAEYLGETDYILKDAAKYLGKENSFSEVNVGVYFGDDNEDNIDPYFNGEGPKRSPCIHCGGCMVGCRYNAKNTLMKNYLYFAEKLGVDIQAEREVVYVKPVDGKYEVKYKKSTGILHKTNTLQVDKVIFSGGVMGTIKLLFQCKNRGFLSKISERLGDYVRTNSESILGVRTNNKDKNKDFTKGIAISAGFKPDDNTYIETCRYSKGQNSMSILTTYVLDRKNKFFGLITLFKNIILHPILFFRNLIPYQWSSQTVILLIMQPINNYLRLSYQRRWWRLGLKSMNSELSDGEPIPSHIPIGDKVANIISKNIDGVVTTTYMDSILNIPTTAHILGGASIGKNIKDGVVDDNFEIFNYPGLYVIDGSSIPVNLGVNPSLTITAMAEYAMSKFKNKEE